MNAKRKTMIFAVNAESEWKLTSIKVSKVNKPAYDAGSYARNPANHIEVEFADGEKVNVRVGDGRTIACGLCYQFGMPKAEYGRLAIEAVGGSNIACSYERSLTHD